MKHKQTSSYTTRTSYRSILDTPYPDPVSITAEEYARLLAQDKKLQLLEAQIRKIKQQLEKLTK